MGAAAKAAKVDRTTEAVDHLLAIVPDAMIILGGDGRMVRVNAKAEQLFGYPQEKLLGQKPDLLMPWHCKKRHMKRRAGQGGRQITKMRPLGVGLEAVLRRQDGT